MKKYLFSLMLVSFLLFACKENLSEDLAPSVKSSRITETITRDFTLTIGDNPNPIAASVTVIIDSETEEIVQYYFSQNVLQALEKTSAELDAILRAEMGDDYFLQENLTKGQHSECMAKCRTLSGRQRRECRTDCWIDTAVRVLEAILRVFKK